MEWIFALKSYLCWVNILLEFLIEFSGIREFAPLLIGAIKVEYKCLALVV